MKFLEHVAKSLNLLLFKSTSLPTRSIILQDGINRLENQDGNASEKHDQATPQIVLSAIKEWPIAQIAWVGSLKHWTLAEIQEVYTPKYIGELWKRIREKETFHSLLQDRVVGGVVGGVRVNRKIFDDREED